MTQVNPSTPSLGPWREGLAPTWSSLRRLGASPVVRLTAVAPLLGSLILLNDEIARLLHSTLFDGEPPGQPITLGLIPISRLHLSYLGLAVLGLGSLIYALRCPLLIKDFGSVRSWIETDEPTFTEGGLGLLLSDLATNISKSLGVPQRLDPSLPSDPNVPLFTEFYVSEAIARSRWFRLARALVAHLVLRQTNADEALAETIQKRFVRDGTSVSATEVFACIYWCRDGDMPLVNALAYELRDIKAELLSAVYCHEDRSRLLSRILATVLMLVGFIILALPTLHTVAVILSVLPAR